MTGSASRTSGSGWDHTRVRFDIREKYRVTRRQPTAEEKVHTWRSDKEWVRERQAPGQLALKIQGQSPACLRAAEWIDQDQAQLEIKLGEIVASIIETAAFTNEVEAERARAEHARWEAQVAARRRAEQEAADLARQQELLKAARAWRDAALIRDYVAAVRATAQTEEREVSLDRLDGWARWAKGVARTMSFEALAALPGINEAVEPSAAH